MTRTSSSRMARLSRRTAAITTELLDDRRCVLYVRGSTAEQQNTLDAQLHEGRAWAVRQGISLDDSHVFIDSGTSGSKPLLNRPKAREALAIMKRDGIATFVVLTLDRAFRDTVDMHLTIQHLLDQGFNFRMVTPDLDLRGPVGKLVAGILGELAQFELACRSERQMRGFDSMRRQKIARCQFAPYGWDIGPEVKDKSSHSGRAQRLLVPNPKEQEVLKRILAAYQGNASLQSIADTLNKQGIPTKRAGQTMVRKGRKLIIEGTWKPQHIRSVVAHAEIAANA